MTAIVTYNHEYTRKVRACFIGAGGHSFRNVYPTFQYAPVDLVAICDRNLEAAGAYARQFGAQRHYADHREMLEREAPDVVFIVTAYHEDGRVQATDLAMDCLAAGAHVWMEKPTAASLEEIDQLTAASDAAARFVMTGLKKTFFPTVEKVKQIIDDPAFGTPASVYIRYPQEIPPLAERDDLRNLTGFLDHIYHPAAVLRYLLGDLSRASYEWEPFTGGSVTSLRFRSGAVGTMHLVAGMSGSSPRERLEVVGEGTNVVVDNGVKLTYYRRAELPAYGRAASFLVDDDCAPLHWEPEFSLGQLHNKNLFYLGYVGQVVHFCESVLAETPPTRGTLEDSRQIMRLFEFYRTTPPGTAFAFEHDRPGA